MKAHVHSESAQSRVAFELYTHVLNEKPEELKIDHQQRLLLLVKKVQLISRHLATARDTVD